MSAPVRIGIDLGGTKIEAVALDTAGAQVRWRRRVPTPPGDYDGTLRAVAGLVEAAERELGAGDCSVGIGTPGSATADGRLKGANSTCLNDRHVQRDLEALLRRPVKLANDANCLALSEATDGAGAGADVVFAVILGTGVGAGVVVHGRLLTGPNAVAGEWGHNPLPWAGADETPRPCWCGQRGCIETWLSGPSLAADHERAGGARFDAAAIVERAAQGDAACCATLARYESRLARALAHVVNVLDPDVVVLGGGVSRTARLYANVPARWHEHVFAGGVRNEPMRTRLLPARHGDSSGVRGAARLWG